jgi:hypothetical protein
MKKVLFFISIFLILISGLLINQSPVFGFENKTDKKTDFLDFYVDGGNLYFFEPETNTVYIYSSRGEFRRAYVLEKPGLRMKSLSTSEIRELIENKNEGVHE